MDPNATLRRWREAKQNKDREAAHEAKADLQAWIGKGGFYPSGLTAAEKNALRKFPLRAEKVRLNRGGYDSRGRYFGTGAPLYRVSSDDGRLDQYVRAESAMAAKNQFRVKNPECKGSGPKNRRVLRCRNPENPTRYVYAVWCEGYGTKRVNGTPKQAAKLKKFLKAKGYNCRMKKLGVCNPGCAPMPNPSSLFPLENPRRHFPQTPRGRPKVNKHWIAEIYSDPDGAKLGTRKLSTDKQDAYDAAKGMVGTRYKGKIVHKVILDGPK